YKCRFDSYLVSQDFYMLNKIFDTCDLMKTRVPRNPSDAFTHLQSEVEELRMALLYKDGEDGIFGEAIDVILCAFDVIFLDNPQVTNEEVEDYIHKKLDKWV